MRVIWMLLVVGVLVGCGERSDEGAAVPVAEEVVLEEPAWRWFANEGEDELTAEEESVLAAVQRLVEERREPNWRPVDYLYEVEKRADGTYQVFLRHLMAYRDGEGMQTPGGHSLYIMDAEGALVDFMPGR